MMQSPYVPKRPPMAPGMMPPAVPAVPMTPAKPQQIAPPPMLGAPVPGVPDPTKRKPSAMQMGQQAALRGM